MLKIYQVLSPVGGAKKNFLLGNHTLDEIAIDLFKGDLNNLEKNSRKIKKYFDNKLFSTFMLINSALLKNDLNQAKKYLQILENFPKADYIYKRVKSFNCFERK